MKNNALKSDSLPSRIKVFNWGRNETLKGDFWLDDRSMTGQYKTKDGKTLFGFNDVQKEMGWDTIALDYEHNTVPGTQEYLSCAEPRPVAAHLKCEIVRGDGMYCNVQDWTPSGKENAKNYADLSGSPLSTDIHGQNVIMGMHSVALTQHGATEGLTFLTNGLPADLQAKITTLSADFTTGSDNQTKAMDKETKKILCAMLSMDELKSSDEEVMKCMSSMAASGKIGMRDGPLNHAGGTKPEIKTFSADEITKLVTDQVAAIVTPLTASVTFLTAAAEASTKASEKSQRDALVAQAGKEGKIIPLSTEAVGRMPVADLQELVKALPKSTLQTRQSNPTLVKANDKGTINKDGAAVVTLNVNGTEVPVTIGGGGNRSASRNGLKRTSEIFAEQLNNSGIYCRQ